MSKHVTMKALGVSLGVIVAGQILSFSARRITGQDFTLIVFIVNVAIPFILGFPIAYYIFRQNERLRMALEDLRIMHERIQLKATTDHLTGLLNRETFMQALKLVRSQSAGGALLMIDVDHFKSINDMFGHFAGDTALKSIATAINDTIDPHDIFGRMGGEEFCVFLRNVDANDMIQRAEAIRHAVEAIQFLPENTARHPITISIGISFNHPGKTSNQLLKLADKRLYEAKARGRNCVYFG